MKKYLVTSIVAGLLCVAAAPVGASAPIRTTLTNHDNVIAYHGGGGGHGGHGGRFHGSYGGYSGYGYQHRHAQNYYYDYYPYDYYYSTPGYYYYDPYYYSPYGSLYFWW